MCFLKKGPQSSCFEKGIFDNEIPILWAAMEAAAGTAVKWQKKTTSTWSG